MFNQYNNPRTKLKGKYNDNLFSIVVAFECSVFLVIADVILLVFDVILFFFSFATF